MYYKLKDDAFISHNHALFEHRTIYLNSGIITISDNRSKT